MEGSRLPYEGLYEAGDLPVSGATRIVTLDNGNRVLILQESAAERVYSQQRRVLETQLPVSLAPLEDLGTPPDRNQFAEVEVLPQLRLLTVPASHSSKTYSTTTMGSCQNDTLLDSVEVMPISRAPAVRGVDGVDVTRPLNINDIEGHRIVTHRLPVDVTPSDSHFSEQKNKACIIQDTTPLTAKERNRLAQKRFRERQKALIASLQGKVVDLTARVHGHQAELSMLRRERDMLVVEMQKRGMVWPLE
ncbi:hypothetical protein BSKO_11017 [Bryopsis sp. KO-2023]|nr:hypothetical protein BSKO_11017 [Bryopsis sp. KO-2023]